MSTLPKWILATLIVITVVLGYRIYINSSDSLDISMPKPATSSKPVTAEVVTPKAVEKKAILTPPGANATASDLKAWGELVSRSAIPTTSLDITACSPSPIAAAVNLGSNLTLVNKDTKAHVLVLNPTLTYSVDASSTKSIKADFGKGAGIYAYGCDTSGIPVGVLLVK